MANENEMTLMSEAATAKYAGIALMTLRSYRKKGLVKPVEVVEGLLVLYDADAIKIYFDTSDSFRANKIRIAGVKCITLNCAVDANQM